MIKKIISFILLINVSCADCTFQLVNYSNETIKAEVGFLKNSNASAILEVPRTQTKVVLIKSSALCDDIDQAGLGTAYVKLIGGKSSGGWIYSPQNNRISALGKSATNGGGVVGYAANGTILWLQNNYSPKDDVFQVVISKADRNISKPSSLNPN